jgi:hypothetical protein
MSDGLPAVTNKELVAQFIDGSPMQRLLGATLERLGGIDFVQEWAEENPSEFMRLLMAAHPGGGGGSSTNTINLNMHPALSPGVLDRGGSTIEHD